MSVSEWWLTLACAMAASAWIGWGLTLWAWGRHMKLWKYPDGAPGGQEDDVIDQDEAMRRSDAIAYGWDGGKARAFEALLPYVRHHDVCAVSGGRNRLDDRCTCGLRSVWRIRETPEDQT